LSMIMQWIKTRSAVRWNIIYGSIDHMWGKRYFARAFKDPLEFEFVMDYIDQNPVVAIRNDSCLAAHSVKHLICYPDKTARSPRDVSSKKLTMRP